MSNWADIERVNSEIEFLDVKGKNYAPVHERIKAFRKIYPEGAIVTEIVSETDKVITVKATVYGMTCDPMCDYGREILATGHAFEVKDGSYINKTSYLENCETSAIGRALGIAGFGIEGAICSAEELHGAEAEQDWIRSEEIRKSPIGIDRAIALQQLLEEKNVNMAKICEQYRVEALEDLTEEQHRNLVGRLNKVKK